MESNNLTEKLNTFTSLVLKDAEQKREKLLENVQKEYSERIDAKENELCRVHMRIFSRIFNPLKKVQMREFFTQSLIQRKNLSCVVKKLLMT